MPSRIPPLFPPSLLRRIALARSNIPRPSSSISRSFHISSSLLAKTKLQLSRDEPPSPPSSPAISALLARLTLPNSSDLHDELISCLTHPSFHSLPSSSSNEPSSSSAASSSSSSTLSDNSVLATLGNSLLGLFTSEHLALLYPELPTEALKSAVTAYVGPKACVSVARELGVSVMGQRSRERDVSLESNLHRRRSGIRGGGALDQGVLIRYFRAASLDNHIPEEKSKDGERAWKRQETFEDVVASVVRAFIGLIYQEKGIHAAREFTQSHFLSRHLDMTTLFAFKNPKHVLSSVVAKHLVSAGLRPGSEQTRIESRVIASTGTNSQAPLFNIGLFLPNGLKLSEGHGSSLKMAEHRASMNALHSLYLVRSDPLAPTSVPSSAHPEIILSQEQIGEGLPYAAGGEEVKSESLVESSRGSVRR